MRTWVAILGLALVVGLGGCTGPDPGATQPVNNDPVTETGPEICALLPKPAVAHLTARAEESLSSVGDLPVGRDSDRGQCEVVSAVGADRRTVAKLRVDAGQVGTVARANAAIQIARDRKARAPLPNPLRTGTSASPSILLAITCGTRPALIGIDIAGYDTRRKSADQDLADLSGVVAAKYGDRLGCRAAVAPPLEEQQRGTVRMMAGNGGVTLPNGPAPGPATSIGQVEAVTTAANGDVFMVSRDYPIDQDSRGADSNTIPWGQSLRILRIRSDGVVDIAWDPNLAPFSVNADPVAGDISEKLRLQGRDTLGVVSAITVHNGQAWLIPAGTTAKQADGTLARPIRIVQLNGGRAVDLRAIKAQTDADSSRIRDPGGKVLAGSIDVWNESRFTAVSFDGDTPVLLDSLHGRVWRIDLLSDGKIVDATVFPVTGDIAPGSGAAGLTNGRFAVSSPQGGLTVIDGRGKSVLGVPLVNAEIDGIGLSPLELGRRQIAQAGEDILVHAMISQVNAPALVRVDGRTGTARTIQVSGYPGASDSPSDQETARFAPTFGTAATATGLFSTGWPVEALGAVGQNVLMSPFGTRILYELVPRP
jgi:hypothetical protein